MSVLEDWLHTVCRALAVDETLLDRDLVLDLTKDVAHNVARPAAPLTAFVVGLAAGQAGATRESISQTVQKVAALAGGYVAPDGE